jgi:hypothetical protein
MIYHYRQNEKEIDLMSDEEINTAWARSLYLESKQENSMKKMFAEILGAKTNNG